MEQEHNLAWAAGLFEGEGSFTTNGQNGYLMIDVVSTDLDVLETFARVVGGGRIIRKSYKNEPAHYKPKWTWRTAGTIECLRVFRLLEPWLLERRRGRFHELYAARMKYERSTRFANRSAASRSNRMRQLTAKLKSPGQRALW